MKNVGLIMRMDNGIGEMITKIVKNNQNSKLIVLYMFSDFNRSVENEERAYFLEALRLYLGEFFPDKLQYLQEDEILSAWVKDGKPYLENQDLSDIHFSISHSEDNYAVVFASYEIGLDIEALSHNSRSAEQMLKIANRFFHLSEWEYLQGVNADDLAVEFLKLWTSKEAYVKMLGKGIAYEFSGFSTVGDMENFSSCIRLETDRWGDIMYSIAYNN